MSEVTLKENISSRDTFLVNSLLKLGVSVQSHVAYIKTTRKELAREAKVSTKTITRKLQKYGDIGLISFEHKTGAKGGLIIKLNPDKFNFENMNSPLTNPTKKNISLLNKLFPAYNKKSAIRRTKSEMAIYREERSKFNKLVTDANNLLISDYIDKKDLDWEFFNSIGDNEHTYQVWLLSRAYDSMVNIYEKMYVNDFNEPGNDGVFGYAKPRHKKGYRSLDGAFVGSYNYKSFERLINFATELNQNPILVMSKVFERYAYTHHMYNRKATIPVPNQLIDKNGKRIVNEAISNQKKVNKFNGTMSTDFMDSPEMMATYQIYTNYAFNHSVKPASTLRIIHDNFGDTSIYHYYTQLIYNLSNVMSDKEVRAVDFYIRQQVLSMVDNRATTILTSNVANMAIKMVYDEFGDGNVENIVPLITQEMGSIEKTKSQSKWVNNAIEVILSGVNLAEEVYRIEFQRHGMFYTATEIADALNKAVSYVPVSASGMIKRAEILTGF